MNSGTEVSISVVGPGFSVARNVVLHDGSILMCFSLLLFLQVKTSVGDVSTMSINQQAHAGPPYGQPQPGYPGYPQPSYGGQPMAGVPPSQYGAYNGPVTGHQQMGPPQGSPGGPSGGAAAFWLREPFISSTALGLPFSGELLQSKKFKS